MSKEHYGKIEFDYSVPLILTELDAEDSIIRTAVWKESEREDYADSLVHDIKL